MGLVRLIAEGFAWTLGNMAAKDVVNGLKDELDDPSPEEIAAREKKRQKAERAAARAHEKATRKAAREKRAAKKRQDRAIEKELRDLKKRL
ncbi:MAG: hypothetical protein AAGF12_08940 [Myxococcota bacterium]